MELEPWDIAVLVIGRRGVTPVDVEHAYDSEFEAWIQSQGIPVDNESIGDAWSFGDRCDVINHALKQGMKLSFVDPAGNKKSSESEQKEFPNNSERNYLTCAKPLRKGDE